MGKNVDKSHLQIFVNILDRQLYNTIEEINYIIEAKNQLCIKKKKEKK